MDIHTWLDAATSDARRRGLEDVAPLLTALARMTEALRTADFESAGAALAARKADPSAFGTAAGRSAD